MLPPYSDAAPDREALDAMVGPLVLEFGSNDCGICRGALPFITQALETTGLPHIRVQDGKGRRLGRTFGVKLWPTLIVLRDGRELARVVRPGSTNEISQALRVLAD